MKLNLHPKGIPKQEPLGADTPLKKGGVVVGMRKEGDKEKIYFVGDDCHLLCVGATRSGKSRCLVLESICLLGLAGESIFCSDPKAELFHYTADFLKKLGYEVLVLDFKNPEKSMRYNLLQPIIDAINEGNTDRAEMLAWDLTNNLVGKPEGEKIWTNGECSIIAAAILCVVCDNQKRPEFQNMTNVYWFISEMCRTIGNKMPLLEYVKKLSPSHPARALLSISDVAPSRTRGSFYTSALTTLRLFTSKSIYAITHTSDFTLTDMGSKKQALFVILPDEKTTFYPIASLIVSQQYELLAEAADRRGGRLERRVNFILDEYGNFTPIGEANFSDHGANRLGASALMQGLADGYFVLPYTIGDYLSHEIQTPKIKTDLPEFEVAEKGVREKIAKLLSIQGKETVDDLHKKLGHIMWENVGMARSKESLEKAIVEIQALRKSFWANVRVPGTDKEFNQELEKAVRLADFLELGELMARDALNRNESCGGHFRVEYQTPEGEALRDDEHYVYVAAWEYTGKDKEPELVKEPLAFETVHLAQRNYKD